MPYIPAIQPMSKLSTDTLNAIGADIGVGVNVLTDNSETLFQYAKTVLSTTTLTNAFLSSLVNTFAQPDLIAALYEDNLKRFKKGILDYGEGRQEVFVEIAKGVKENKDFANPSSPIPTKIPDVYSAFHVVNLEAKYETSVQRKQLRRALTSENGIDYLVNLIISRPKVAYEKDENTLARLMLGLAAIDAIKAAKNIESTAVGTDAKPFLKAARKVALSFPDLEQKYTLAGNYNSCRVEDQTIILPHDTEATVDVDALASAYNLSYADFIGQRVSISGFTFTEDEKARILAITDLNSWPISDADAALLDEVQAITCDKDLLYIFDVVEPYFTEFYNGSDDIWNYYYHVAACFSYSPFHNIAVHTKPITRVSVTFNKNNASATGTMTAQSIVSNVPTALKANAYSLADYHFKEWNTAAAGTGTGYTDEQVVTLSSDTTLYAIWEADA